MRLVSVDATIKLPTVKLVQLGRYLCDRFIPRQVSPVSKCRDRSIQVTSSDDFQLRVLTNTTKLDVNVLVFGVVAVNGLGGVMTGVLLDTPDSNILSVLTVVNACRISKKTDGVEKQTFAIKLSELVVMGYCEYVIKSYNPW